jgi:hypothetical protein
VGWLAAEAARAGAAAPSRASPAAGPRQIARRQVDRPRLANATDDNPNPTSLGGPTRHQASQILSDYPTMTSNRLSWHSPRVRQSQTLGFPGHYDSGSLRNRASRATAGLVGWRPRRKRTPVPETACGLPRLGLTAMNQWTPRQRMGELRTTLQTGPQPVPATYLRKFYISGTTLT